jgi:hypothetical protein
MLAKSLIKKMNVEDRLKVRDGAGVLALLTGAIAYFNYRQRICKEFLRSEAHYRFSSIS